MSSLLALACVFPAVADDVPSARDEFAFDVPYIETVADNDAIPGGIASVLAQDREGFLWIGTRRGLVRFDGYAFRTFAHRRDDPASLAGDVIGALATDASGALWVGTRSDGVSVRAAGDDTFRHYHATSTPAISSNEVRAVLAAPDGVVWIGSEGGLDRYDPARDAFTAWRHDDADPASLASDRVHALLRDRGGDLWIGTRGGLDRLRRDTTTIEHVASDPSLPDAASLHGDNIVALYEAEDGKLWIGTAERGVAWLAPDRRTLTRVPVDRLSHPRATAIAQPRRDEIWIATMGGGINVLDAASGAVRRQVRHAPTVTGTLALDQVGDLLVDRAGLLWIGTWGGGLQRFQPQQRAFRSLRADLDGRVLSDANISSVLETDDGRLWVGTRSRGVDIFDRRAGKVATIRPAPDARDGLADGAIYSLAQTRDGSVWLGTQLRGVFRVARDGSGARHYGAAQGLDASSVLNLHAADDGALWFATNGGLARWSPVDDRIVAIPHADGSAFDDSLTQVVTDRDGRLWVGGSSGLYTMPRGARGVVRVPARPGVPGGLVHDDVRGLLVDRAGVLWIATAQGLARLAGWQGDTPRFDDVSAALGVPGLHVGGNLLDDAQGRLWTQWYVIDPARLTIHPLGRADGFDVGTAWNGSFGRTRDGLLLYGGAQGLVIVDPAQFVPWRYEPPVVATQLLVDGRPQPLSTLASPLSLDPRQRGFSVEFAALDYSAPQRLRYAYRLVGFDREWIETDASHRVASYTNLAPGDYVLEIRGSNRLGQWSRHELQVPVRVLPAFWQTGWFIAAVVVAASLVVYALFRWRLQRLRVSERRLRDLVDQRTALLRQQTERLQVADGEKTALLEQLRRQSVAFERQAREDALTGLDNRRAFDERLADAFSLAVRHGRPLAVAMIDVDHFKRINDERSHAAGDLVLRQVAQLLRARFPRDASVARYGGEEFAVLLPDHDLAAARAACDRVRDAIAAASLDGLGDDFRLTVSIGVSDDTGVAHPERMIAGADAALYAAKRAGRNRVCC